MGETEGAGEGEGLGDTGGLGVADAFGEMEGVGVAAKKALVVLCFMFQLNAELLASAFSRLATVTTSPPLKVPSVLLAGSVAVGAWPTGMGS